MRAISQLGSRLQARNGRACPRTARTTLAKRFTTARRGVSHRRGPSSGGRRHGVNIFEEGQPMWRILLVFLVPLMLSNVLAVGVADDGEHLDRAVHLDAGVGRDLRRLSDRVLPVLVFLRGLERRERLDRSSVRRARHHQGEEASPARSSAPALYLGIIVAIVGSFGSTPLLSVASRRPPTSSRKRTRIHASSSSSCRSFSSTSCTRRFCAAPATRRRRSTR